MTTKPVPGSTAPHLEVETVSSDRWRLADQSPENLTMVVFYRGLHCPICKTYLRELEDKLENFQGVGINAIAVSGDTQERAEQAKTDWGLERLTVGYDFDIAAMRRWGLYISPAASAGEPPLFGEPALFLVRPDKTLYYAAVNNAPWGRPQLEDVLSGIEFALAKDYPIRGTE